MIRRLSTASLVAVVASLVAATSALAYWAATGSGSGAATTGTLAAPTAVTANATNATVAVNWTASAGSPTPDGYLVTRTNSSNVTANACGTSASQLATSTSCSDTNVPPGTYTYKVTAIYKTWTADSAPSSSVTVNSDTTAPNVSSINRQDANPTNASSVSWTVTFTESVIGVDSGDFSLANGTGVSGTSITNVSGSGTTWTVSANTGSGSGTLGLNLTDNDSIVDGAGNKLGGTGNGNGNATGQTYTIDKTAPTYAPSAVELVDATTNASASWINSTSQTAAAVKVSFANNTARNTDVARVTISDGTRTTTVRTGAITADNQQSVTVTGIDASLLNESKSLTITASMADSLANISTTTKTGTTAKDVTAPTLTAALINWSDGSTPSRDDRIVGAGGAAGDPNSATVGSGTEKVYAYPTTPVAGASCTSAAPCTDTPATQGGSAGSFSITVGPWALSTGVRSWTLTLKDQAGNSTTITKTFTPLT